jgi:ubiquinone/menaquinone biosynthesis C-methylase UbiE
MADGSNGEFRGRRWYAALYEIFTKGDEKWVGRYRPHIVGEAGGRVLEIGAGTGQSFSHYERAREVVATEPDPFMLGRAQRRLEELGLANVQLRQCTAEDLPFEDGSFDHVVSALVLCTVQDPVRAISEARRVLKPGGTLRFIEHVRYDDGLRGRVQDIAAPVWRYFGGGCHLNRRTEETITEAGFEILDLTRHKIAIPGPVLVGVARRP